MKHKRNRTEEQINKINGFAKNILALSSRRIDNSDIPEDVKREYKEIIAGSFNAAANGNVDLVKKYQKRYEAFKTKHYVEPEKSESIIKIMWDKLFSKTELV